MDVKKNPILDVPCPAWIWNCQIEMSIATLRGRPFFS
jgi:hypothetical protein